MEALPPLVDGAYRVNACDTDHRALRLVPDDELLAVLEVGFGVTAVPDAGDHLPINHRHVGAARQIDIRIALEAELVQGDLSSVGALRRSVLPMVDAPGAERIIVVDRDATGRIDMRRIGTEAIVDVDAASPGCRGGGSCREPARGSLRRRGCRCRA